MLENDTQSQTLTQPIIRLEKVTKRYSEAGRERTILNEVSLNLMPGEFTVLLGKSGSGKSTLLNLIGGIDDPSSGDVIVNGQIINRLSDRNRTLFRRQFVGFVFQAFNLIATLSALENVMLPIELGNASAMARQRALVMLDRVGLASRASAFPDHMSGGEQQRVAIARALVTDPLVVLADEPTGNLDSETGIMILKLLDSLTRQAGRNLVMVTHNAEVVGLADQIYTLKDGKFIASAT